MECASITFKGIQPLILCLITAILYFVLEFQTPFIGKLPSSPTEDIHTTMNHNTLDTNAYPPTFQQQWYFVCAKIIVYYCLCIFLPFLNVYYTFPTPIFSVHPECKGHDILDQFLLHCVVLCWSCSEDHCTAPCGMKEGGKRWVGWYFFVRE